METFGHNHRKIGTEALGSVNQRTKARSSRRTRLVCLVAVIGLAIMLAIVVSEDQEDPATRAPARLDPTAGLPGPLARSAKPTDSDRANGTRAVVAPPRRRAQSLFTNEHGSMVVQVHRQRDDSPVAGVVVESRPLYESQREYNNNRLPTDAGGRAFFDGLVAGPHEVKLDRGVTKNAIIVAGKTMELSFRIPHGLRLRVRVVDQNEAPISSARIWIYPTGSNREHSPGNPVGRTDLEGRFVLRDLVGGMRIGARAPGYVPSELHHVLPAWAWDAQEVVLKVQRPAAALRGEVVGPSGSTVTDAIVCLVRGFGVGHTLPDVSHRVDGRGRFEFNDLRPGFIQVWAFAPGLARAGRSVNLEPGVEKRIGLRLGNSAVLAGYVLDGMQRPIANAAIVVLGIGRGRAAIQSRVQSDANGEYRFVDLAPGVVGVRVAAHGFEHLKQDVELSAGIATQRVFTLKKRPLLSGRVLNAAGAGLHHWVVEALRDGSGTHGRFVGKSNTAGEFVVAVDPNGTYRFRLRGPGQWFTWDCEHLGPFSPGDDPVDIIIPESQQATAYVRFVVVDTKNQNQRVWYQLGDGERLASPGGGLPNPRRDVATGEFLVGPVPPRAYRLTIHSLDNSFPRFRTREFWLSRGQRLNLGRIKIPVHGWLACHLRSTGHIDLADLLAQIAPIEDPRNYTIHKVDADGRGRWPLLPGRYTVTVYGGGIDQRMRDIVVRSGKSTQLELELRPGARVRGKHR
jgi:Carboxypeptidase regulatory-like domain